MTVRLQVSLGSRSYPIEFGASLSLQIREQLDALRAAGRRILVVTDESLQRLQAERLAAMVGDAPRVVLPPGEGTKSLTHYGRILDALAAERVDRTGAVVAIGGGVIGDLAGFAAASYLRGVALYQIPTTLLSMVDSSVGGKTGLNLDAGKNLVGAFHQPKAVFISTDVLGTLPPREFAAGMAEVIKYGLLGDRALFERLAGAPLTLESADLSAVIRRCCELKAKVVEADEFELAKEGGRALLNLGHTFGHAIEQVTGYGTYLHGEAVAIGLCAAARLSVALGLLPTTEIGRVDTVVAAHALPVRLRKPLPVAELMAAMARDKKVRAGRLRFVVMTALGTAITKDDVAPELAADIFRELGAV